jgi:hypothetical protein
MSKLLKIFTLQILLLLTFSIARAEIDISTCSVLNQAGETYRLTANILNSDAATCMDIIAENITLDCQGYLIDGILATGSVGIYSNQYNTTVRNCRVIDWERGLYLRNSNSHNLTNITTSSNLYAIFIYNSNFNNLTNIISNSNVADGLELEGSNFNTLINIIANSNDYGLHIQNSDFNTLTNITTNSNSNIGIWIDSSNSNTLTYITANSNNRGLDLDIANSTTIANVVANFNYYGVMISTSEFNNLTNITANSNTHGLWIDARSNSNILKDSRIQNSSGYGIWINNAGSPQNLFYNNLFNNTENFNFFGSLKANYWNTTKQLGTRIYSPGTEIGGNYWTNSTGNGYSDTCEDADQDGFCDSPHILETDNVDYLPLSDEFPAPTQYWDTPGECTISDTRSFSDVEIIASCDVVVEAGGVLNFSNVDFKMDQTTHWQYSFTIQSGGTFNANESTILNSTNDYNWKFYSRGNLTLRNVTITRDVYHVYFIGSSVNYLNNVDFANVVCVYFEDRSQTTIIDSDPGSCGARIYSNIAGENVTVDGMRVNEYFTKHDLVTSTSGFKINVTNTLFHSLYFFANVGARNRITNSELTYGYFSSTSENEIIDTSFSSTNHYGNSRNRIINSTFSSATFQMRSQNIIINSTFNSHVKFYSNVAGANLTVDGMRKNEYFTEENLVNSTSGFKVNITNTKFVYPDFYAGAGARNTITNSNFHRAEFYSSSINKIINSSIYCGGTSTEFYDTSRNEIISSTIGNSYFFGNSQSNITSSNLTYTSYFQGNSINNITNSRLTGDVKRFHENSQNNITNVVFDVETHFYGNSVSFILNSTFISPAQIVLNNAPILIFVNTSTNDWTTWSNSNTTLEGSYVVIGGVTLWELGGNVTRYFPTLVEYTDGSPIDGSANITDKDGNLVWEGSIIDGYVEPIIIFNFSNYGSGNFTLYVNGSSVNFTDVNFLTDTPITLTLEAPPPPPGTWAELSIEETEILPDPVLSRTFVYSPAKLIFYLRNIGNRTAKIAQTKVVWITESLAYLASEANPTYIGPGEIGIFEFETQETQCEDFGKAFEFYGNVTYYKTEDELESIRIPSTGNLEFSVDNPLSINAFTPSLEDPIVVLLGSYGTLSYAIKNLGVAPLSFNFSLESDPPGFEGLFIETCCPWLQKSDFESQVFSLAGGESQLFEHRIIPATTGLNTWVSVEVGDNKACKEINQSFRFLVKSLSIHKGIVEVKIASGLELYSILILLLLALLYLTKTYIFAR